MKVYVAAKFEEKERVRELYRLFGQSNTPFLDVTHDWTKFEERDGGWDFDKHFDFYRQCGELDLQGVLDADVVVVFTHPNGKGMYVEIGAALAHAKPVIAIGPHYNTVFFACDAVYRVETVEEAMTLLASGWMSRIVKGEM